MTVYWHCNSCGVFPVCYVTRNISVFGFDILRTGAAFYIYHSAVLV